MADEQLIQDESEEIVLSPGQTAGLQSTILGALVNAFDEPQLLAERMSYALANVTDEFMEGSLFPIWRVVVKYYHLAGALPSPEAFDEMLEGAGHINLQDRIKLSETYKGFATEEVSTAQFKIAAVRLAERWRDERYAAILSDAQRIHMGAHTVGKEVLSGFEDSNQNLKDRLTELERLTRITNSHEGDINLEVAEAYKKYLSAKKGETVGVLTGFAELDEITQGLQQGELWLIAGYTNEGKSKIVYNVAYTACYLQGKNVVFGANEATRQQVRLNMITRHSHHPKFNHPRGLRYSDIKFGTLTPEDEEVLKAVLQDMRHGEDHGSMFVLQMPSKASPDFISEALQRQAKINSLALVVIDYLGLMSSASGRRAARREELDDVLLSAKRIAIEFDIPLLSPWQMSRQAWMDAQKSGRYTKASLADTSQAEKTTDIIMSILKPDDAPDTLKCQILKNRDGVADISFDIQTDFATSLVSSQITNQSLLDV